jgi:CrcB protein
MNFLMVFIGGGCGSLLRYAIGLMLPSSFFPWTTLGINIVGSVVLGLVAAALAFLSTRG